jgi:hypothetical protein
MNRHLTYLIGPETVLLAVTAFIFQVCAQYGSGAGRDVDILERLVVTLPLWVVPLVFATIVVPGGRSWSWLARAIILTLIGLLVCAGRIIEGFGSGAKGQDAAFILVIAFGAVVVALASSITGAMILGHVKPSFADWFRQQKVTASVLTLASAVPISFVLAFVVTLSFSIVALTYSALKS